MYSAERRGKSTPNTQSDKQKNGSGWNLLYVGCFGLIIVLSLTVWGVRSVYTNVVVPWFEETKEEIVEDSPFMEDIFEAVGDLGIGGIDLKKIADMDVPDTLSIEANKEGSVDAKNFPQDVFIPEGSKRSAFRISAKDALAVLEFPSGEADKMRAVYKKEMKKSGWKIKKAQKSEEPTALRFAKKQRIASVSIFPAERGVEVWLRVSSKESGTH